MHRTTQKVGEESFRHSFSQSLQKNAEEERGTLDTMYRVSGLFHTGYPVHRRRYVTTSRRQERHVDGDSDAITHSAATQRLPGHKNAPRRTRCDTGLGKVTVLRMLLTTQPPSPSGSTSAA